MSDLKAFALMDSILIPFIWSAVTKQSRQIENLNLWNVIVNGEV